MNPTLIAEVKTASPFGFTSKYSWDQLFEIANTVGDIISIHTDPRWGGSFKLITTARKHTNKPILAKGIHATDEDITQAIDVGADYVLVVGRVPGVYLEHCWIEPMTLAELAALPQTMRAVWNSRDLLTGGRKTHSFDQALEVFQGWLCQASNITCPADVHPAADAVIVGSALSAFATHLGYSSK